VCAIKKAIENIKVEVNVQSGILRLEEEKKMILDLLIHAITNNFIQ
jgi:hypothetical protein